VDLLKDQGAEQARSEREPLARRTAEVRQQALARLEVIANLALDCNEVSDAGVSSVFGRFELETGAPHIA
jgi:hypothetical protein